jgi:hypothetical protein
MATVKAMYDRIHREWEEYVRSEQTQQGTSYD